MTEGPLPGGGEEGGPPPPPVAEEPELEGALPTRPEESDEMRENMPMAASKQRRASSVGDETVQYGDRMRFAAPHEMRQRRKMKLPRGMKIASEDGYETFDQEEFDADHFDADEFLERVRAEQEES